MGTTGSIKLSSLKKVISTGLILTVVLTNSFAQAKICVVTDIDDTIKISNSETEYSWGNISNFLNNKPFSGAFQFFNELMCSIDGATGECEKPTKKFNNLFYLTASSSKFAFIQKNFLKDNNFPKGNFLARKSGVTDKFRYKYDTISKFYKKNDCTQALLFGDDASLDPEIFNSLGINSINFIHSLYENPTYPEQIKFLTFADLSLRLYELNIFDEAATRSVLVRMMSENNEYSDGYSFIPNWASCSESLVKEVFTTSLILPYAFEGGLNTLKEKALKACL